ncbi:MAG: hypothetical protein ABFR75_01330 [Acidobacteriota bacterium]
MKKIYILIILFFISILPLRSIEVGLILGNINESTGLCYGVSVGSAMLIPLVKFEFEYYRLPDSEYKAITTGLKIKPRLGDFSPYAVMGIGTDFIKFNLVLSDYKRFAFYGGGLYYYFLKMVSVRIDLRIMNYSDISKTRITGGLYINI